MRIDCDSNSAREACLKQGGDEVHFGFSRSRTWQEAVYQVLRFNGVAPLQIVVRRYTATGR